MCWHQKSSNLTFHRILFNHQQLVTLCHPFFYDFLYFLFVSSDSTESSWSIFKSSKIRQRHWRLPLQQLKEKYRKPWRKRWRNWYRKMCRISCWWPMPNWAVPSRTSWTCNAYPIVASTNWWDAFDHRVRAYWLVCRRKKWPQWHWGWRIPCHATNWNSHRIKLTRWLYRLNAFWMTWTKNWIIIWWEPENGKFFYLIENQFIQIQTFSYMAFKWW